MCAEDGDKRPEIASSTRLKGVLTCADALDDVPDGRLVYTHGVRPVP
jgi:hypothetical protein